MQPHWNAAGQQTQQPTCILTAAACPVAAAQVGLGGELRPVGHIERRIGEALKVRRSWFDVLSRLSSIKGYARLHCNCRLAWSPAFAQSNPPAPLCLPLGFHTFVMPAPANGHILTRSSLMLLSAAGLPNVCGSRVIQRARLWPAQGRAHRGVPHGGGGLPGGAGQRRQVAPRRRRWPAGQQRRPSGPC